MTDWNIRYPKRLTDRAKAEGRARLASRPPPTCPGAPTVKFRLMLKDPDGFYESIEAAVRDVPGIDEAEKEAIREVRREKLKDFCARWVEYGEYLTVEIDTDERTCTVVPVGD